MSAALLLSGCSGLGKFFGDTITLPGMNPNLPYGVSETSERAEGRAPAESAILPEPGNIWPGPPQPLPTLSDVSRTQGNGLGSMPGYGGSSLHDGGSMSMGESDMIAHGAPPGGNVGGNAGGNTGGNTGSSTGGDADGFSGSGGPLDTSVPDAAAGLRLKNAPGETKPIIIPNGDGTSTVIEPNGTVKTVKTPPK
ncbi:hypothetical protein [Lichenicoccus sp.]|uniref:hypothetical protein n=1 Tax=Lichenicoccus sp. TaxID=2781899 RepID=UPI003D0A4EBC